MMTYELWEIQSGNVMAAFENESQALAAVVERARLHGRLSVNSLALVRVGAVTIDEHGDEDAEMEMLVAGPELLARATASTVERSSSPTPERDAARPLSNR
jgi:hypothetical protein